MQPVPHLFPCQHVIDDPVQRQTPVSRVMAVSISKVTFENNQPALGIGSAQPRISWRFDGSVQDWEQHDYDLQVSRAALGGQVQDFSAETAQSLYIDWPGEPLGSHEAASVRVRTRGTSSTPWSDWVTVETGLLNPQDWSGAMPITAKVGSMAAPATAKPTYLRKTFNIPAAAQSARLYITGLGIYEAEINGQPVSEDVLAPGYTSYQYRHVYDTYDVTKLLRSGNNTIGVVVAQGWYGGRLFPLNDVPVELYYGYSLGAQALLRVQMDNGTVVNIPTDGSWKGTNQAPLTDAGIYDGVSYDSRLDYAFTNWSQPVFDDRTWSAASTLAPLTAELASPDAPPVRRQRTFPPKQITKSPSGKTIIDFGQNFAGWLKLTVKGPAGTNITLQHAEVLQGGELALRPLRTAKATDTLILHGNGTQVWEPRFTFHGFRYAQIDGWPAETPLDSTSIQGVAIWSDLEETGTFQCSNALLNQFHSNVQWSMRSNLVSIPTDCPQRDERMGWTGDAHVFGPTANYLYNTASFWRGWHKDIWSEMSADASMAVPTYVPLTPPGYAKSDPVALWGDVAIGGPWNLWRAFGDPAMLAEHRVQAKAWLDKGVRRRSEQDGGLLWDRSSFQFGDWLDPSSPPSAPGNSSTAKYLVADAYLVRMTELMANISAVLGDDADAQQYRQQHASLRAAYRKAWVAENGNMANHTQTAYVLGIMFDILDAEGHDDGAAARLVDLVRANDHLVDTGFAATWLLGHAMTKAGADADFYAMLLQTKLPSWLYQVVMGATTTWERWDSLLPDGSLNPGDMTSFNHYAFGAVADWMHSRIGGLAPSDGGPGWKEVDVSPVPGGGITSAKASFLSGYGKVSTNWHVDPTDGSFHLALLVPPNARAVVTLPFSKKVTRVKAGLHRFVDPVEKH